jgi:hypothetical protein
MKHLIIAASLISTPALADSWAMPNRAGGEIVLTDRQCPGHKSLNQAYNYSDSGKSESGCWTVIDGMVHVVWDGVKGRYTYPIDSFYVKSKDKKGQGV